MDYKKSDASTVRLYFFERALKNQYTVCGKWNFPKQNSVILLEIIGPFIIMYSESVTAIFLELS